MDEKIGALRRLVEIVEHLRAPEGCPWDQQQTLLDMGRHMVEEVSEVVDAIEDSGGEPSPPICEELGDLLMNVLLAARIAEERGTFGLADVARGISEKLVRRHPHVFGNTSVRDADEVLRNWNAIKAEERASAAGTSGDGQVAPSRLDAVPRGLPPLVRAFELGREAGKAGFDWPDVSGALEKVEEELDEVRRLLPTRSRAGSTAASGAALQEELGDLLFAVVSLCRKSAVRPDEALRATLRKFCRRFRAIEARLPDLETRSLAAMEAVWREEKRRAGPSQASPSGEG